MAKKIQFVFDFNSKDVEIASDRTLTLAQQVKVLKDELQKTKEGTAEFEILRNKLNDTQDSFERVNSKTQDLFGTLSLIPGPIGEIAGKLNGTVSLFKTFSNFSFKDLKTQFTDVVDDVVQIGSVIGKATGLNKVFAATTTLVSKALKLVGVEATTASIGVRAFSAALLATGIGAIVVGLGLLVEAFISAGSETEKYTEKLDALNREISFNREASKRRANEEIAEAKARGASEEELGAIRKRQNEELIKDLEKTAKIREQEAIKAAVSFGEESDEYKKARDEQITADKELSDARSQARIDDFNQQADLRKKNEDAKKEEAEKEKQLREKQIQENKQYRQEEADAEVQLIKDTENTKEEELRSALKKQFAIKNEGKKLSVAVQKAQAAEIERIVKEELDKDKKSREDRAKEIEQQAKETLEARINLERKLTDIRIAAIANEVERERAARQEKLKRDIEDLNQDKEFLKLSEIEKAAVIANLRKASEEDLANITKNAREKEKTERVKALDDQLQFIDLQFQSIRQGTEEYFALREEQLKTQQQKELEGVEKGSKEELAILKKYSELKKQLRQEETQAIGQTISATLDAFTSLGNAIASTYDEEAKTSEEAFNKRKKLQKATALISAASGIVQILTQPSTLPSPIDFIVKTANALALGIATKAQIDKINATSFEAPSDASNQQPRRLAKGGLITGEGGPQSDMVPALLSNGESVINATSTQLFRPLLSTINEIGGGRRFANGGVVSNSSTQQQALEQLNTAIASSNTAPIKTYVVATDMTSQQMFDRAQKSRSTL